jgi:hypothetical protein
MFVAIVPMAISVAIDVTIITSKKIPEATMRFAEIHPCDHEPLLPDL